MKYHEVDSSVINRAQKLQNKADKLTAFRKNHSDTLGLAVGITKRNWMTTAGSLYLSYTDYKDGREAKKAQRLLGADGPLSNGAIEDPIADKKFRSAMIKGMEYRALREKDYATFSVLAMKQFLDKRRDERMARDRDLAQKYTDLSLGALQINRIKTATEMAGILLHVSPLAKNSQVRNASLGIMAMSTAIGIYGERQYAGIVNDRMNYFADKCPDEIDPIHYSENIETPEYEKRNLIEAA